MSTTDMKPADVARLTHRLTQASEALRELLELVPEPLHRLAFELACGGAQHGPSPCQIAEAAQMLARYGARARGRRATVLRLARSAA